MANAVYVYNHNDVDITTTGLVGDLQPIECIFTEEKNGESGLSMRLVYDSLGKWKAVKPGCYIKAKVPVRVPPKIIDHVYSETLTSYRVIETVSRSVTVWESNGTIQESKEIPGLKQLYYAVDRIDTSDKKPVKYKYTAKAGDIVQLLKEDGEKCKVYSKSFGTGWMLKSNLEKVQTVNITGNFQGVENVTDAVRMQYQLFQVNSVEQTLDGVSVTAMHVFYELLPNFTTYRTEEAAEAPRAIEGIFSNMLVPDERFTCLTDYREQAGGALDYSQQNVVQALLDPENGICARYGLSLIRDNYDLYALKNVGSDRGFVVEYSKNMLDVEHSEDITDVVTRIVPYGLDASGKAVYLDEMFVDSPHIGDYPFPRVRYLDCTDTAVESKEKGKEKTLAQVKAELKERAEAEFAGGCDQPVLSMTVSFISLGDTEEFKQYKDLDKVFLFDKITILDKVRGYDYTAEVVGITHNVLTGILESVTLGSIRQGTGVRKIPTWQVPAVDGSNIRLKSIHAATLDEGVGSQLDLSGNQSIISIVGAMTANFVQYEKPTDPKKGDIWINTGSDTWGNVSGKTWAEARRKAWGAYFNPTPITRVWDGTAWQLLADQRTMSIIEQKTDALSLRIETVDGKTPDKVVNTAVTLDKDGIRMKTGGTFTVDSGNFDVDDKGNVSMRSASVSGNLMSDGAAVLTAKNLVVSTETPKNPIKDTVWVRPMGVTAATFVYNNNTVKSFKEMESENILQNLSAPAAGSGTTKWNVSIPYKVTSNVTAERYLRMTVDGMVLFDKALSCVAGTHTFRASGELPDWLGDEETLSFTLELHFQQGNESYLHNVHRLDTGAVELSLTTAGGDDAKGWVDTVIKVYKG